MVISNKKWKIFLNIYILRSFQWYKNHLIWTTFAVLSKIQEFIFQAILIPFSLGKLFTREFSCFLLAKTFPFSQGEGNTWLKLSFCLLREKVASFPEKVLFSSGHLTGNKIWKTVFFSSISFLKTQKQIWKKDWTLNLLFERGDFN